MEREELRVMIVEDDLLVSESLAEAVTSVGMSLVDTVESGEEALPKVQATQPHIVLMDIQLAGDMDGIDTAREIQHGHPCIFVFLSEVTHLPTLRRLSPIKNKFYLPKPVTAFQLQQLLPQLIQLIKLEAEEAPPVRSLSDSIFISHRDLQERVRLDEIRWLKSEHNYTRVVLDRSNPTSLMANGSLGTFLEAIHKKRGGEEIVRIHKSYAINLKYLTRINGNQVVLGNDTLDVGKTYRKIITSLIEGH